MPPLLHTSTAPWAGYAPTSPLAAPPPPRRRSHSVDDLRSHCEVLAFFACPSSHPQALNFAPEINALKDAGVLRRVEHLVLNGTLADLQTHLLHLRPRVLHLSMHGSPVDTPAGRKFALLFAERNGSPDVANPDTIAGIVGRHARSARGGPHELQCVVLNACDSLELGAALHRCGVPNVVCWATAVSDQASAAFTRGFFAAVTTGTHFVEAFHQGRLAMESEKLDEGDPNAHRLVRCPTTDRPLRYADGTPLQRAPDGRIRRYSRVVHGIPRFVSSQPAHEGGAADMM